MTLAFGQVDLMYWAASASRGVFRATITRVRPWQASCCATSRPIPCDAPVTRATAPESINCTLSRSKLSSSCSELSPSEGRARALRPFRTYLATGCGSNQEHAVLLRLVYDVEHYYMRSERSAAVARLCALLFCLCADQGSLPGKSSLPP